MDATVPSPLSDISDLPDLIDKARRLFSAGDIKRARMLAAAAGAQAKAQADVAKRFGAAGELVAKARRLQGDALLIEARASIRIADEYDAAQAKGEAAKQGRPKKVSDGDHFTLEEAGLTKQEVADARKLRDAEAGEPGIVERAIAARLAQGLEPTRRSLRHAVGNRSDEAAARAVDYLYETPIEAMRTLLALESFSPNAWEPAVGRGAILRPLEDAGYDVAISDLRDRGVATRHGECQAVIDFLDTDSSFPPLSSSPGGSSLAGPWDIITNPPYGAVMNGFIAHALRVHRPAKMALLLNWNAYLGFDDPDRNFWLDEYPPARIWAFSRRLPMMHRDGWDGKIATSQMNTAWFVWEASGDPDYPYGTETIVRRVDWKDFENLPALKPGEAA